MNPPPPPHLENSSDLVASSFPNHEAFSESHPKKYVAKVGICTDLEEPCWDWPTVHAPLPAIDPKS